ncbi:MAG: sodium ion-translocating decarboxylase subunit beta [Planctomycetota bacterium]|nr:MAG: sodium ion-translocating decarboxylase subunit beta [Planctomycetota bacterium]REJ88564.1 MAG: sodium ion-translocating decarboxylase subunit beta [Planctomycetota bacterium]REK22446.1 MAG: sodium ion-translocating decarboxylase subunit beta [Planctomycetota bacterium]REK34904.1 MAG: sodium ion-translocating decarboxylase subunit beta [Planctomycetota bacterium]
MSVFESITTKIAQFWETTAFAGLEPGNVIMIAIAGCFIYLAIAKHYEPLLLVPIGFGIIVGNIPSSAGVSLSVYDEGSVLRYLYFGVEQGIYPPLIFLGIGAMTDFSTMLSNPKLVLLGAAAQVGVFLTYLGALAVSFSFGETTLSFSPQQAGAIGIIGGADGPTAIFLSSKLAPDLLGAIAIAAYSYMALVPVIQPPIMRMLTTRQERLIRMKPSREVSKLERILFPIVAFLICTTMAPGAIVLIGMLFFGNLMKECAVTDRLALTARSAMIDIVTMLLGFCVGASTNAQRFLQPQSILIFVLGALSFAVATAGGVLFAKLMNLFFKEKINPLVGAAGVSAVPDSARVVQMVGQQEDPGNFLLMHAMAPNVAGVIGSAIAAGVLWSQLAL